MAASRPMRPGLPWRPAAITCWHRGLPGWPRLRQGTRRHLAADLIDVTVHPPATARARRWVLFVNVPIGLAAAVAAPGVLGESGRQRSRFDLPDAITVTAGYPPWSTGCRTRPPARTGSSTGATPRSWPRWWRRWCCSVRSRSSRPVATTRCCRCAAPRPGPDRREPDHAVCRHCRLRHVLLLLDRVHAVCVGVLGARDRPGLPAADRGNHGGIWCRRPTRTARRHPAAAAGRLPGHDRRPVLAVADQRAQQLFRRGAGPDAGHRHRSGPAARAGRPGCHVAGPGGGAWGRGQPAQHRPAGRRLDRARRARHRRLDRRHQHHPRQDRPHRRGGQGRATRRAPARPYSSRSSTMPWPPASPAPSWSRPASCCLPWSSRSRRSGYSAPTSARPGSEPPATRPQTKHSLFTWREP